MQFFFVQDKAARGILKLIHELMQTELQNPSGEAQARKFICEQDAVKQLSIINVPVIVNLNWFMGTLICQFDFHDNICCNFKSSV